MHVSELPASRLVVQAADSEALGEALGRILGYEGMFTSFDIIEDSPSSGRVLYVNARGIGHSQPLPEPLRAEDMAEQLVRLTRDSRYPFVSRNKFREVERGWEVRVGSSQGIALAIVVAVYVPKLSEDE